MLDYKEHANIYTTELLCTSKRLDHFNPNFLTFLAQMTILQMKQKSVKIGLSNLREKTTLKLDQIMFCALQKSAAKSPSNSLAIGPAVKNNVYGVYGLLSQTKLYFLETQFL